MMTLLKLFPSSCGEVAYRMSKDVWKQYAEAEMGTFEDIWHFVTDRSVPGLMNWTYNASELKEETRNVLHAQLYKTTKNCNLSLAFDMACIMLMGQSEANSKQLEEIYDLASELAYELICPLDVIEHFAPEMPDNKLADLFKAPLRVIMRQVDFLYTYE